MKEKAKRSIFEIQWQVNPIDKSAGHYYGYREVMIRKILSGYKYTYVPDIVILEWTECILYVDVIKKLYPKAKIIGFIHDVCFQKIQRQIDYESSQKTNLFLKIRQKRFAKFELESYKKCDHLIVLNYKDKDLLTQKGIRNSKCTVIAPFFENLSKCHAVFSDNILFWGDLRRIENYTACVWFIDNVFNKLKEILPSVGLVLAGKDPGEKLAKYKSDKISITGFVENIQPVFENAFCFAAPLFLGAGIKIKILEAMSAALPVLTGDVGIEGIGAKSGEQYIHCNTSEDYINEIVKLFENKASARNIGIAGRNFVNASFSIKDATVKYFNLLKHLTESEEIVNS